MLAAVAAGAFYAGRRYKGPIPFLPEDKPVIAEVSTSPIVTEDPLLKFERARREVDREPAAWMAQPNEVGSCQPGDPEPARFFRS